MIDIIFGIDPDAKAHGVAKYFRGELIALHNWDLPHLILHTRFAMDCSIYKIEFHIEDVCANNAIFRKGHNMNVQMSIARRLGMVQQAQVELERYLAHYDIKVVKHKISKMWKKDKNQFERATGWKGRSNEDKRSAAYFGWLGLNRR